MFLTIVQIFCRKFHKKKSYLIETDKRKHLRGEISLVNCRGHDGIMLFYVNGFYDNHIQLLSKNIYFR